MRVVLPAPFGPSNPKNSPCGMSRSIPESACSAPKRLWTSRNSIAAVMPGVRPSERSARRRLKQLGDSVELGEVLHRGRKIGEAQSGSAFGGLAQPLDGKGDRSRIHFGDVAEIDYACPLPQVFLRGADQPGNSIQGHPAPEDERIAVAPDHDLPDFARSRSLWRFFAASDLIRPSTPCSLTSLENVSR